MATHVRDFSVPPDFPTFTGSQLVRALLLVLSEDLTVHPNQDTRMYLCLQCLQKTLNGQRMMTFGSPDAHASEEERLIEQLRSTMYPHGMPLQPRTGVASSQGGSLCGEPVPEEVRSAPAPLAIPVPQLFYPQPATIGPFSPEWDPKEPWIASPSDSTNWYVVTVGKRIGVFDDPSERDNAVVNCPGNSSSMVSSRSVAIERFNKALLIPDYVHVVQ